MNSSKGWTTVRAPELQYCRCEIGQPEPTTGDGCPIHGRDVDVPDPDAELDDRRP